VSLRVHLLRCLALALVLLGCHTAHAQGGPPFLTDDPETPGNKHWEINFGYVGNRNPAAGAYQVPDFDINYGLGDRIQLKYELPIAIQEQRLSPIGEETAPAGHINGGLGESLLGVKWRFYQHHPGDPWLGPNPPSKSEQTGEEPVVDFSVSTYPQLSLDNPTRAVARGLVPPGPDFFLPIEMNARAGPIRFDTEFGYHFGNHQLPQSWIRGLLVGHEFTDRTEAYAEIYDQQDANRIDGAPKQRQTTLGLGGRQALNQRKTFLLMLMGGRSFQTITPNNSQPSWIAYVGLQMLLGPKEPVTPQVEQKLPNETKP
jgi:hypothetical protein